MTTQYVNIPPNSGGGDVTAAYLLVSGSQGGTLTNSRTIVAGSGMQIVDGGALGSLTLISTASQGPAGPTGSTGNTGPAGTNGTNGTNGAPGGLVFTPVVGVSTNMVNATGLLLMSTSVGTLSASLNTGSAGQVIVFKDCQGSASVNPFTVFPVAGAKIDGVSSSYAYYANFGALRLTCDGKDWFTW